MTTPVETFDDLYGALCEGHARAAAIAGEAVAEIAIADRRVVLRFAGDRLRDALLPALAHLVRPVRDGPADLAIAVWDSAASGRAPPRIDPVRAPIGPKGVIPALSRSGGHAAFAHGAGAIQAYDAERGHAAYWTDDAARLPYWERSMPFRQILAWFLAPTTLLPVHAACVARGGRGVLLPGASGRGKSTTALRLALEGFGLVGDDYVLIDARPPHRVWSLYRLAKVDARALLLLPELARHARRSAPDDEKAVIAWPTPAGGCVARDVEPAAIVLPRIPGSPGPARLTSASPGDVVLALAPTTINHLDAPADKVLAAARGLALAVPAHHLELGSDHCGLSALVDGLLRRAA